MTEVPPPITFVWEGDCFRPAGKYWQKLCDKHFVIGERKQLASVENRNMGRHAAFFATVHEAWLNLPDGLAAQYPSADALRYRALIQTGYCTMQTVTVASAAEARRIAMLFQPDDQYSVVIAKGNTVVKYKAMSQRVRAMGPKVFDKSVEDVLAWICQLLGVTLAELKANAGKSGDGKR